MTLPTLEGQGLSEVFDEAGKIGNVSPSFFKELVFAEAALLGWV